MRSLAIACGLLLAACSTTPAAHADPNPVARVHYSDLQLADPAAQDALVVRVREAAVGYCREHAAIVTPHHRRADPSYCPASIRAQLLWAMPPQVRRAYDLGWGRSDRRMY